jgi:hypothetical protein
MLNSDNNDFYIGERKIKDQEKQSTEIIKIKNLQNCDLSQKKLKCKLVKIENRRGHPNYHFEIDGKIYFYGIYGIKANYEITLRCTKTISGSACNNCSTIFPSDFLKEIIQNSPTISKYLKIVDKSDPRVYDLKNYDLNSFDIGEGHKCPGTEIKKVSKLELFNKLQCKLVKIVNSRGFPNLHIEINGKMYFYGIKGVKADNKVVLRCHKSLSGSKLRCNNLSTVLPSDFLKEIIQKKTSELKNRYANFFDKSDPRVYDIDNYDINSFDLGKGHKCPGMEIDAYEKYVLSYAKCQPGHFEKCFSLI